MNIILFGSPGAGKGTQAEALIKRFNLFKISTGELLRKEIEKETKLGKELKLSLDKGMLVSDDIVNTLIDKIVSKKEYHNRLIFDGYPRTLNQANKLENLLKNYNQKLHCVFILNIKKEIIVKRILGRKICSKCQLTFNLFFNPPNKDDYECKLSYLQSRSDDNQATIENRFDNYSKEADPIINFYKNKKILYEIDGTRSIEAINSEISSIISSLKG